MIVAASTVAIVAIVVAIVIIALLLMSSPEDVGAVASRPTSPRAMRKRKTQGERLDKWIGDYLRLRKGRNPRLPGQKLRGSRLLRPFRERLR